MKRLFLLLLLASITITLTACNNDKYMTEDEVETMLENMLPEEKYNTTYDLDSFQEALYNMIEEKRDAVVAILVESPEGYGTGSGVIYKKEGNKYYVITSQHVIDQYWNIRIVTEDEKLTYHQSTVEVIGEDRGTDLALLTFESEHDLPTVDFANSYETKVGEIVFAIGTPISVEYFQTVTMGVIGGDTKFLTDGSVNGFSSTVIHHDAEISVGNSGGALLNIDGELVGINSKQLSDTGNGTVNIAIPSNTVKRIILDLEDDGVVNKTDMGWVIINDANCQIDRGGCVLVNGGAAEAASLVDWDVIIGYKINDMEDYVTISRADDLREIVLDTSVGDTIQFLYIRSGVEIESIPVEVEEK